MHVPLVDLKAQYFTIKDEVDAAVARVMSSGRYVMGEEVEAFESEWAAFCGARYCVGVGSGTEALYLALLVTYRAHRPGAPVITTPLTFFATTQAIVQAGLLPRFEDVGHHGNLDLPAPRLRLNDPGVLYLPVDLYGRPVENVSSFDIVDSAQAHGVPHRGLAACWSFYPTKNLAAAGQAGAVTTDDEEVALLVRKFRAYGEGERFVFDGPYFTGNHRMDSLQAAILRAKLPHLRQWNTRRRAIAAMYQRGLAGLPGLLLSGDHPQHVYHAYVVQYEDREALRDWLNKQGVETQVRFPRLVPDQPVMREYEVPIHTRFPIASAYARRNLNLPIYPEMTVEQVEYVVAQVKAWVEGAK